MTANKILRRAYLITFAAVLATLFAGANTADIFHEWHVALNSTIRPAFIDQVFITINGMFPGPLINATTNDIIHVNVFNDMDEPILFTWNGIQQRLNSWQDGVSGTNCPIKPATNWTYVFQIKDQIGSFFYFPSISYQKAAGGFGPIRVNNLDGIATPFPKPDAEFDLLVGDSHAGNYSFSRTVLKSEQVAFHDIASNVLMNGKGPYGTSITNVSESFNVTKGKTYRIRISNVGSTVSLNVRIESHKLLLVETEGSYTNQILLDSLDVHVGQSYSVLVKADQSEADYYIVASSKLVNDTDLTRFPCPVGIGVLHYSNSVTPASGPLPEGPDPFDLEFSLNQARSIRWNLTSGAARPNPQGSFNVSNVTLSQTFILEGSRAIIDGLPRYVVNNVSYCAGDINTPLKLADHFLNGSGVYQLDTFPTQSVSATPSVGVTVVSGTHKGWLEIVFKNNMSDVIDSWHFDGFGFYFVGFGNGEWSPDLRDTYNLYDPVVRSTVQVYPGGWTAVYVYLDNPGMWNLRSQVLKHWYLGQELYVRVFDSDPNPAKERPPPENLLLCGILAEPEAPVGSPAPSAGW